MKLAVGETSAAGGLMPCEAAVMAPVPRADHRTLLIVSGPGAERFAELLGLLGASVEAIGGELGDAAQLKLMRSVFMKGLATVIIEALGAAELSGQRERLVTGTHAHAGRREHEVSDALAELQRIGAPHDRTSATLAWFRRILAEQQEP